MTVAGLDPLWDELARRMSTSDRPVSVVTLRDLDVVSRQALADLLGSDRLLPPSCRVSVAKVAAALGVDDAGLRAAVEERRGPLGNRAAERAEVRARRDELWQWFTAEAERLGAPGWAARVRAVGVPRADVDAHRRLLEAAVRVLERLPAEGVSLPVFARSTVGDPHGLDHGRALAALVRDALAARAGVNPPRTAEEERALWAGAGVAADALSPVVLVLGLDARCDDPVAQVLASMAGAGEPAVLTLAQLQRWPVSSDAAEVLVVENPSVLAEAARTGRRDVPLVCTSGWPNVAVLTLLRQLAGSGAVLRCHADFDPSGLEITRLLIERVGATPWKMNATDYACAAGSSQTTIDGRVPDTPWDPPLAEEMRRRRVAVYEEDVLVDADTWNGSV